MNDKTDNTDWLNNFPALSKQKKEDGFMVPDNFFGNQQEQIHSAIFADELKSKFPSSGFSVPNNYFESMQEQVLSVIKLEEMRAANPPENKSEEFFNEQQGLIAARVKINEFAEHGSGFAVPENYFEDLTYQINKKTGIKEVSQPAKIQRIFTKPAWKYAVAACVAIAIATGVSIKQYQQTAESVQNQLSNLPDADIEDYLKLHADSYDNHIILENSTSDIGLDLESGKADAKSNANQN